MRNYKVVKSMENDQVIEILKKNVVKHPNDSRQIIKHKNNLLYGNQFGVILSNIDLTTFEVFVTAVIDKEVISPILYTTFNNINEATDYYNKLEQYIIKLDMDSIVNEINKKQ